MKQKNTATSGKLSKAVYVSYTFIYLNVNPSAPELFFEFQHILYIKCE